MSWFKRRPKVKEVEKKHPHHTSLLSEKFLEDAKKTKPVTTIPKRKPKD